MLVWLLLMETESVRLFGSFFIIASRFDVLVGLFVLDLLRFLFFLLLHNLLLAARAKRTFLRTWYYVTIWTTTRISLLTSKELWCTFWVLFWFNHIHVLLWGILNHLPTSWMLPLFALIKGCLLTTTVEIVNSLACNLLFNQVLFERVEASEIVFDNLFKTSELTVIEFYWLKVILISLRMSRLLFVAFIQSNCPASLFGLMLIGWKVRTNKIFLSSMLGWGVWDGTWQNIFILVFIKEALLGAHILFDIWELSLDL